MKFFCVKELKRFGKMFMTLSICSNPLGIHYMIHLDHWYLTLSTATLVLAPFHFKTNLGFNCISGELKTCVNTVTRYSERLWFSLINVYSPFPTRIFSWELSFLCSGIWSPFVIGGSVPCFWIKYLQTVHTFCKISKPCK